MKIEIRILNKNNEIKASILDENEASLVFQQEYEAGDIIEIEKEEAGYLLIQLDEALKESLIYSEEKVIRVTVPYEEKKQCYCPKAFSGALHVLHVKCAPAWELKNYRNLALNPFDSNENDTMYPHATANIETRGESVFAARNTIDGNIESRSHGIYPYESWGINRNPDATLRVLFGKKVRINEIALYLRTDFPHDSWWTQASLSFSDGSSLVMNLEKTHHAQSIAFDTKEVEWVELHSLIKAEDESPFPALTQLEIYGVWEA